MHKSNLAALPCSLARTLQVVGEWWTLLVLRDVCFGWNRFEEIHDHLGIARNMLTARLETLIAHGLVERRSYCERPARYEYLATEKGSDLVPALLALVAWGDRWTATDGPPVLFSHAACGHDTVARVVCSACAEPLARADVGFRPGPGSVVPDGLAGGPAAATDRP
jgi:DNA-binding HxlR family transcriptional regulator